MNANNKDPPIHCPILIADNETKIAALQAENAVIAELFEKNEKIVSNIENLLSV